MINNPNNNPPWHSGVYLADTEHDFLPTDDKYHFDLNCQDPVRFKYIQEQGWAAPKAITYKINSHGFRCNQFVENSDCIITLGCSFTIGIGLPVQDIWPEILGRTLGLTTYNLGWGGSSADTCFRLAEYWIPRLAPKAVFMLAPPPARFELIMAKSLLTRGNNPPLIDVFLPASESVFSKEFEGYLKHWFINEENSEINRRKNKLAIAAICKNYSIPCHLYDSEIEMSKSRDVVEFARDFMHSGPPTHYALAALMEKDYRG